MLCNPLADFVMFMDVVSAESFRKSLKKGQYAEAFAIMVEN